MRTKLITIINSDKNLSEKDLIEENKTSRQYLALEDTEGLECLSIVINTKHSPSINKAIKSKLSYLYYDKNINNIVLLKNINSPVLGFIIAYNIMYSTRIYIQKDNTNVLFAEGKKIELTIKDGPCIGRYRESLNILVNTKSTLISKRDIENCIRFIEIKPHTIEKGKSYATHEAITNIIESIQIVLNSESLSLGKNINIFLNTEIEVAIAIANYMKSKSIQKKINLYEEKRDEWNLIASIL